MKNFKVWVEKTKAGNYVVRHETNGHRQTDYRVEKTEFSVVEGEKLTGKNLADALCDRVKQKYYESELGECDLSLALEPFIHKYIAHCEASGLAWMTTEHYETVLKKVATATGMNTLTDLSDEKLRFWKEKGSEKLQNSTVAGELVIVFVFCRWLIDHGYMKQWPFKKGMIPFVKRPEPKYYRREEWEALDLALADLDPMARLACNLAYYAGLRKVELVGDGRDRQGVLWEDLTWHPDGEVELMVRKETAKGGGRSRSILLDPHVVDLLGSRRTGPLIKIERRVFWYLFYKARRKAKINPKLTLHGLRHSFAKNYLQYGNMDLSALKDALGHRDIKTTQIYSAHEKSHLASGIRTAYKNRKLALALSRADGRKDGLPPEMYAPHSTKTDANAL